MCRCLEPTKDGRLHLSFECASTLSHAKVAFSTLLLLCSIWFFLRPSVGLGVSGSELALEPMSASDRKVVHDTIAAMDGVTTTSEGDEPRRRVVVRPA